jgi:hypothetical protein
MVCTTHVFVANTKSHGERKKNNESIPFVSSQQRLLLSQEKRMQSTPHCFSDNRKYRLPFQTFCGTPLLFKHTFKLLIWNFSFHFSPFSAYIDIRNGGTKSYGCFKRNERTSQLYKLPIRGFPHHRHQICSTNIIVPSSSSSSSSSSSAVFFCCGAATQRGSWPPHT